nr:protein ALTERED PHOSPHATE STARVATION RESPONSE 1-like [Lolium perenne]
MAASASAAEDTPGGGVVVGVEPTPCSLRSACRLSRLFAESRAPERKRCEEVHIFGVELLAKVDHHLVHVLRKRVLLAATEPPPSLPPPPPPPPLSPPPAPAPPPPPPPLPPPEMQGPIQPRPRHVSHQAILVSPRSLFWVAGVGERVADAAVTARGGELGGGLPAVAGAGELVAGAAVTARG